VATGNSTDRLTKAERKEQARLEREEIQRRAAKRQRNRGIVTGLVVVAILAVVGAIALTADDPDAGPVTPPGGSPGMLTTNAPWPPNTEELSARLAELDLPGLSEVVNHIHVGMKVFVNGEEVMIPANVGYDEARGVASPLHTHDATGLVHVEADDATYVGTLGQFFDVWGVRFDATCLGGHCAAGDDAVRVFVDGAEVEGDPRAVELTDNAAVVVTYGTERELPDPIPNEPPTHSG
jgi:hypothetical protein